MKEATELARQREDEKKRKKELELVEVNEAIQKKGWTGASRTITIIMSILIAIFFIIGIATAISLEIGVAVIFFVFGAIPLVFLIWKGIIPWSREAKARMPVLIKRKESLEKELAKYNNNSQGKENELQEITEWRFIFNTKTIVTNAE